MDEVTIELRAEADLEAVRSSLTVFSTIEGGVVRLDRPIRELAGGRHFHLAAPDHGTGTLEVNVEPADGGGIGIARIVLRPHWTGTWAGAAYLRLAEHLAKEVGRH